MPDNLSPNRLTRICEWVFVFCRKGEEKTFHANKRVTSVRKTGQKMYEPVYNYIEAANNDGPCNLNKSTYSSELCIKLLGIYGKTGMTVYDPFMGTGTTGVAALRMGMGFIGSETSPEQVAYARERLEREQSFLKHVHDPEDPGQLRMDI